ncbi:MAG: cytochrome b562 [Saccharospirillum sp.]|nr:cytochrome b562 [Saccharospirillum sp.]
MNVKQLLTATLLSVALASGAHAQQCEDTALFAEMETMADTMQGLARAIRGNDLDSAREALPTLQQAARNAHQETPFSLRNGGADQDIANFRAAIDELNEMIDELDLALANDNQADAAQALRAIGDARRNGHRQFKDRSCG